MSDILAMAKEVLAKRDLDGSQSRDEHSEDCAYIHPHCLIDGLVKEIARLREERRWITTLLGKVETLEAENERLREEQHTLLESLLWGVNCKPTPLELPSAIAARHAEDEASGPFVGRRSEQARLDRGALLVEIARLREERRSITTLHQKVESLEADNKRLREERRWVPVGERLPEGEEWVDVAGLWGESLGWHDGEEWRNVEEDQFPSEVTHWKKRTPGPEANG